MNKPAQGMLAVHDLQAKERDAAVSRAEQELRQLALAYRVEMQPEIERMRAIFEQAQYLLREQHFETACMAFDELHRCAMEIRGVAATYGYRLATLAAASLCRVIEGMVDPGEVTLAAISGHLDVLEEIFRDNLPNDGGTRGAVLVQMLERLRRQSALERQDKNPSLNHRAEQVKRAARSA